MTKRMCMIDYDGRLVCPWHGPQDDDGVRLACGCQLETGAHGRMFAIPVAVATGREFTLTVPVTGVKNDCAAAATKS